MMFVRELFFFLKKAQICADRFLSKPSFGGTLYGHSICNSLFIRICNAIRLGTFVSENQTLFQRDSK